MVATHPVAARHNRPSASVNAALEMFLFGMTCLFGASAALQRIISRDSDLPDPSYGPSNSSVITRRLLSPRIKHS